MNIKKGDVLKHKSGNIGESIVVLGVLDDLYFISFFDDKKRGTMFYHIEELKKTFELPEEKGEDEMLRIAYGSDNVSLNKGTQHIILTKEDLAFVVESAIKNQEVSLKVLQA